MGFSTSHVEPGFKQAAADARVFPRGTARLTASICSARKVPAHRGSPACQIRGNSRGPVAVPVSKNPRQLGAGKSRHTRTWFPAEFSGSDQLPREWVFSLTISFSNPVWMATLNRR